MKVETDYSVSVQIRNVISVTSLAYCARLGYYSLDTRLVSARDGNHRLSFKVDGSKYSPSLQYHRTQLGCKVPYLFNSVLHPCRAPYRCSVAASKTAASRVSIHDLLMILSLVKCNESTACACATHRLQ